MTEQSSAASPGLRVRSRATPARGEAFRDQSSFTVGISRYSSGKWLDRREYELPHLLLGVLHLQNESVESGEEGVRRLTLLHAEGTSALGELERNTLPPVPR